MRKFVSMAVARRRLRPCPPPGAQAKTKQISTSIDVDVYGFIDRHGGVFYLPGGQSSSSLGDLRSSANGVKLNRNRDRSSGRDRREDQRLELDSAAA